MLDNFAISGFSFLFIFTLFKLFDTLINPLDFIANIILIISFGSFVSYYYLKITKKINQKNSKIQKQIRLIAHSSFALFFIITLLPYSNSNYRLYDICGLFGNIALIYSTISNSSQTIGLLLLALYFLFATYQKINNYSYLELLQLFGRIILTIYFTILTFKKFGYFHSIY